MIIWPNLGPNLTSLVCIQTADSRQNLPTHNILCGTCQEFYLNILIWLWNIGNITNRCLFNSIIIAERLSITLAPIIIYKRRYMCLYLFVFILSTGLTILILSTSRFKFFTHLYLRVSPRKSEPEKRTKRDSFFVYIPHVIPTTHRHGSEAHKSPRWPSGR